MYNQKYDPLHSDAAPQISQLLLDVCSHLRLKIIEEPSRQINNKGYIDKTNICVQECNIKLLDISYGIAFLLSPEEDDEQILSSWRYAISNGISTINEDDLSVLLSSIKHIKRNYQAFAKSLFYYEQENTHLQEQIEKLRKAIKIKTEDKSRENTSPNINGNLERDDVIRLTRTVEIFKNYFEYTEQKISLSRKRDKLLTKKNVFSKFLSCFR